jgi:hypothetical protein
VRKSSTIIELIKIGSSRTIWSNSASSKSKKSGQLNLGVIKPRTRVIFFRVSEEEFHEMERACDSVGARSISDFARTAARRLLNVKDEQHVERLAHQLYLIDQFVDRLRARVQTIAEGSDGLMSQTQTAVSGPEPVEENRQ